MSDSKQKSVTLAIVGCPNAGKSTLINQILRQKIAPVHSKPQMTRKNILGVHTQDHVQLIFLDTPGWHSSGKALNQALRRELSLALEEAQALVVMIDCLKEFPQDLLDYLNTTSEVPKFYILNKMDKGDPLPYLQKLQNEKCFSLSALTGEGVPELLMELQKIESDDPFFYDPDDITSASLREIVRELIREKVMDLLQKEIPYEVGVRIDEYKELPGKHDIQASLILNRDSQKGVVIGKGGSMLKKIRLAATKEVEKLVDEKVKLNLFVKVIPGWVKDDSKLKEII